MTPADRLLAALRSLHGSGMPEGIDCVYEWRPPAGPLTPEKENAIKYLQRLRQALELQQADLAIKEFERRRAQFARAKLKSSMMLAAHRAQGSITVESQIIETTDSPAIDSPS